MRRIDLILLAVFLVLAGAIVAWRKNRSHFIPKQIKQEQRSLVNEMGVGVLYNLSPKEQETLLAAVDHFCVKSYERDSCLHHFITCGRPCLVIIPPPIRQKIMNDYQVLRHERGLPKIEMPANDDK